MLLSFLILAVLIPLKLMCLMFMGGGGIEAPGKGPTRGVETIRRLKMSDYRIRRKKNPPKLKESKKPMFLP